MDCKQDKLGRPISVGDYVVTSKRNQLDFRAVVKITNKMVAVKTLKGQHVSYVYPNDLLILPEDEMMLYLLKS